VAAADAFHLSKLGSCILEFNIYDQSVNLLASQPRKKLSFSALTTMLDTQKTSVVQNHVPKVLLFRDKQRSNRSVF